MTQPLKPHIPEKPKKPMILIVEDNIDIAETLSSALDLDGYDHRIANNGAEALKLLETDFQPDLILLDVSMPVMDGTEFLSKRREKPRLLKIPTILMTAANEQLIKVSASDVQAQVRKPMDVWKFLATIKTVLEEKAN